MDIKKINKLIKDNERLTHFEKSKTQEAFWDNEHISKMMLLAHLNPNWDAASRKHETIEKACGWIVPELELKRGDRVLDLGCGPGLYCSKLHEVGLKLVGVDYSKRSLNYAKKQAKLAKQTIEYINMNYLKMDFENEFDAAMLIYCDFGVLSILDRVALLKKIHRGLKPDGKFVFDVWSTSYDELNGEYKNWVVHESSGFWKPTPHLELISKQYFEDEGVSLKQHIIVENETQVNVYNLWEQCYTTEAITNLLQENGFEVLNIVGDLTGTAYTKESKTIGIVARKA